MIKATRCTATAKGSGQQCKRWAIAGGTVCRAHGGAAGQVKQKAAARLALAEALERGDRRPSWEVLADAAHTLDVVAQQVRDQIVGGEPVTSVLIERLIDATERQAKLAKTVLDAGIDERRQRLAERQGAALATVLAAVLGEFGLQISDGRVRDAVARQIQALTGDE